MTGIWDKMRDHPQNNNLYNHFNVLPMNNHPLSRRRFLRASLLALSGLCLPIPPAALAAITPPADRRIHLYNTHTNEHLSVCYCHNNRYHPDAMNRINHILRDHRTGDVRPISPKLIDIAHAIGERLGGSPQIHIISGYRSPVTNARLRQKSRGVAKKSYHMQGQAVDIRIPSIPTHRLRRIARDLRLGGVGYYAKSDFVHVDTGPVRIW